MSEQIPRSIKWLIGGGLAAVFTGVVAYKCYDDVPVRNWGVRSTWGQLVSNPDGSLKIFEPGYYRKNPVLDTFYSFSNNTIIMEETIGGNSASSRTGSSTNHAGNSADQNRLSALVRLHYQIDPKVGDIGVHLSTMGSDNGKKLLKDLMDQAFNAVIGSRPATESMGDSAGLFKAFRENLKWRLSTNNVPVKISNIELLEITGTIRKPIQSRIPLEGDPEPMAGLVMPTR